MICEVEAIKGGEGSGGGGGGELRVERRSKREFPEHVLLQKPAADTFKAIIVIPTRQRENGGFLTAQLAASAKSTDEADFRTRAI